MKSGNIFSQGMMTRPISTQTVVSNLKHKAGEMRTIQQMVDEAINILSSQTRDLTEFGRLLNDVWTLKRSLSDRVSNSTVDNLYDAAIRSGAVGGKLLGAGGGGFMLLFVQPEHRPRLVETLGKLIRVPFKFEMSGGRIVLDQPDGL